MLPSEKLVSQKFSEMEDRYDRSPRPHSSIFFTPAQNRRIRHKLNRLKGRNR